MTRSTRNADTDSGRGRGGATREKPTAPTRPSVRGRASASAATKPDKAKAASGAPEMEGGLPEAVVAAAGLAGGGAASDDPIDVNLVIFGGRLSTDAEYHTYESGATAMRFLVTLRLEEPRKRVDVVPVTLWSPPRHLVRKPPRRDDRMWFMGNVQRRFFEGPDGRWSRLEVVAHSAQRAPQAPGTG